MSEFVVLKVSDFDRLSIIPHDTDTANSIEIVARCESLADLMNAVENKVCGDTIARHAALTAELQNRPEVVPFPGRDAAGMYRLLTDVLGAPALPPEGDGVDTILHVEAASEPSRAARADGAGRASEGRFRPCRGGLNGL